MNNGIKPTRLFNFTGKKHFMRMLKDRHEAVTHPHTPKVKKDMFTLLGASILGAAGFSYSVGLFSPKVPEPPKICQVVKKKCLTSKTQDPCPPEEPPVMPRCTVHNPDSKKT